MARRARHGVAGPADRHHPREVDGSLAELPHTAQHMKALTCLTCLTGCPPKTVRWALENHPRIQEPAAALSR
ncbi:hypothetical protein [Streptomyces acidiscabies]|uniref:hypothetical protein n=1 Tax=Streptomyces acidiscabies TaxID=42234 RepID=UPI0038F68BFE